MANLSAFLILHLALPFNGTMLSLFGLFLSLCLNTSPRPPSQRLFLNQLQFYLFLNQRMYFLLYKLFLNHSLQTKSDRFESPDLPYLPEFH